MSSEDDAVDVPVEDEDVDTAPVASSTSPLDAFATPKSALADNIQKKGSNSYYYAHAGSLERGPSLTYDGEPRKLGSEVVEVASTVVPITKFSWCDNKTNVKVYVEVAGAEAMPEEAFNLAWEGKRLDFRYTIGTVTSALVIPELHESITNATVSRRGDRVTLTLTKASEFSWFELARKK